MPATIHARPTDPSGAVTVGAMVKVRLLTNELGMPDQPVFADGDQVLGDYELHVDADGWSLELPVQSALSIAGTVWEITTQQWHADALVCYVSIPDGAGPHDVADILVDPPGALASSALANHTASSSAHVSPWDAAATYSIGARAIFGGALWESLADDNTANEPAEGASWTLLVGGAGPLPANVALTDSENVFAAENSFIHVAAVYRADNAGTPSAPVDGDHRIMFEADAATHPRALGHWAAQVYEHTHGGDVRWTTIAGCDDTGIYFGPLDAPTYFADLLPSAEEKAAMGAAAAPDAANPFATMADLPVPTPNDVLYPWHVTWDVAYPYDDQSGGWGVTPDAELNYGYYGNGGVGWWMEWQDRILEAGTWEFSLLHVLTASGGTVELSIDGGAAEATSISAVGATTYNQRDTISGIVIPTTGRHTLRLTQTVAGYVGIAAWQMHRTGD
jgi:hypothetical protein